MQSFRIQGRRPLNGTIPVSGAKNAALPALAATLLTEQPVQLLGLPDVVDIRTMGRLLQHLGSTLEVRNDAASRGRGLDLELCGGAPDWSHQAPYDLVKTMRASVLTLGPALARTGEARVSMPGGCAIGVRPIDQHLAGLEALGAEVELEHGYVVARAPHGLVGGTFRFAMETVTGTENVLMAATLARGTTVLERCAREPEVVDLADMLRAMGARIRGDGTETIEVEGVDELHAATHRILPDRIEAGTYLIAAALTEGQLLVEGARARDLKPLLELLQGAGARIEDSPAGLLVEAEELRPLHVETAPHPGFPTDLQAQTLLLATQCHGDSEVVERVFENRFQHVPELNRMGAHITLRDRTASVTGPRQLSGAVVMATDLRASACLVLAGLIADGVTRVDRIYHLDRGYQAMELKLQQVGADVERIDAPRAVTAQEQVVPAIVEER